MTMPTRHRRVWLRAGVAVLAVCVVSSIVQSGVAKVQDASDRMH
jgi:hypothetical protein